MLFETVKVECENDKCQHVNWKWVLLFTYIINYLF